MIIKRFLHYLFGLLLLGVLPSNGFELPTMLPEGAAPEIVDFILYRPAESDKDVYALIWNTKHATKVTITTLGKVSTSGKHVVKDGDPSITEYTLTAFGKQGFDPVRKTVYVVQPDSIGITHSEQDERFDEPFPMSPVRQRMLAPGRYRYY